MWDEARQWGGRWWSGVLKLDPLGYILVYTHSHNIVKSLFSEASSILTVDGFRLPWCKCHAGTGLMAKCCSDDKVGCDMLRWAITSVGWFCISSGPYP